MCGFGAACCKCEPFNEDAGDSTETLLATFEAVVPHPPRPFWPWLLAGLARPAGSPQLARVYGAFHQPGLHTLTWRAEPHQRGQPLACFRLAAFVVSCQSRLAPHRGLGGTEHTRGAGGPKGQSPRHPRLPLGAPATCDFSSLACDLTWPLGRPPPWCLLCLRP